eukprot:3673039-Alexandrium_andersonii.AAC.1
MCIRDSDSPAPTVTRDNCLASAEGARPATPSAPSAGQSAESESAPRAARWTGTPPGHPLPRR